MKLFKAVIIIKLLFFVSGNLFSQSTGYMGKRLSIGYGFHTSPAIFGSNNQNETIIGRGGSAVSGSLAFNAIHEVNLEAAASSKWMICFSTRYYKTIYDNAKELDGSSNSNHALYYGNPNGYYNIRGLTYTLYFKYFGTRYVAPWGRYVMFGPTINTVKTTYDPKIMNANAYNYNYNGYNGSSDTLLSNFGSTEQDFTGVNFMLGFGRSRIIANRVIIDYGCNTQIVSVIVGALDLVTDGAVDDVLSSKISNTNYVENTYRTRVRGINRFNVFLKIGVLLF